MPAAAHFASVIYDQAKAEHVGLSPAYAQDDVLIV